MRYLDTHCHIDRYEKPLEVLKRAEAAGAVTVAVTELPSQFQRLTLRLGKRPLVRPALGMHPLRAASASPLELALFTRLLGQTDYIGEIGLDGSQEGKATLRAQTKVLNLLLAQPRVKAKVLTVHSRGAEEQTIEALAAVGAKAILHWYSGPLKHIETALSAGLWFSVNPAMLRSKNGQRIISELPPDRVLTETDGPYTRVGGRVSEPQDIPFVVAGLAKLWGEEREHVRNRVYENMTTLAHSAREAMSL
jgi:TatD DNase family protein